MSHFKSALLALLSLSFLAACQPEPGAPSPDEDVIVDVDGDDGDDDGPVVEDEDDTEEDTITLSKTEYEALLERLSAVEAAVAANDPAPVLEKVEVLKLVVNDSVSWLDQRVTAEETATTAILPRIEALEPLAGTVAGLSDTADEHAARLDATEHVDTTLTAKVTALETKVSPLPTKVAALEKKTASMTAETYDGRPSVIFRGVNVHLHNKNADSRADGTGNLILGMHEDNDQDVVRSGSYYLSIGRGNDYTGVHGLLVGKNVSASGYENVVFGWDNRASSYGASVLGGRYNVSQGTTTAILGGSYGDLKGLQGTIIGGYKTTANISNGISP